MDFFDSIAQLAEKLSEASDEFDSIRRRNEALQSLQSGDCIKTTSADCTPGPMDDIAKAMKSIAEETKALSAQADELKRLADSAEKRAAIAEKKAEISIQDSQAAKISEKRTRLRANISIAIAGLSLAATVIFECLKLILNR